MKVKLLTAFVVAFMFMAASISYGGTVTYKYDDLHHLTRVDGDTIQIQALSFTEDLNINLVKSVTLEGGYDCNYSTVIGNTTLNGNMTISNGIITTGNFIIAFSQVSSRSGLTRQIPAYSIIFFRLRFLRLRYSDSPSFIGL